MSFIAGVLTALLIINCVLLVLLVLVQLPKKDAGAGIAFGGGAADALFGAGSGNALTKITKWATGILFGMALVLNWVEMSTHQGNNTSAFEQAASRSQSPSLPANTPTAPTAPVTAPTTATSSVPLPAIPANPAPTPAPAVAGSNGPAR